MLGNLSQSLYPVQHLISGGAYLLGLVFIFTALYKLKRIASHTAHSSSQEKMFTVVMYFLMGASLLFLPTAMKILATTAFGSDNVLTYGAFNQFDLFSSIYLLVRTAGLLWFVRGCVLLAHASEPGTQHGPKGLAFLFAGILAMNVNSTLSMLDYILSSFIKWTMVVKSSRGY